MKKVGEDYITDNVNKLLKQTSFQHDIVPLVAITNSIVLKWLRLVHNIHIHVDLVDNTREYYFQPEIINSKDREYHDEDMIDQAKRLIFWSEFRFDTFEKATEQAIIYCLQKLI